MASRLRRSRDTESAPDRDATANSRRRALLFCSLALPLLIGFYALVVWRFQPHTPGRQLDITEYTAALREGAVQDATIRIADNRIVGTYDDGRYWVPYSDETDLIFGRLFAVLAEAGVPTKVAQQSLRNLIQPVNVVLPSLILIDGLFIMYLIFGIRGDGASSFGRSNARRRYADESSITFAEVAGLDEPIEELAEVRDYLVAPERFQAIGAAVPKGILLMGPPGCGKTLLARALAGECHVPFFSISGADFVEIFVGVGPARIRDLFATAKKAAPAIIFIDELDAVGRARGLVAMGGQDEREATLNQLLVEMDGFDPGAGVVVVAATNRPDILDSALLRPGRFDRRVTIDRPDVRGREGILEVHARKKPLAPDVDLRSIAKRTVGFSGADLANVVNEAALLAARKRATTVATVHLSEAIERVLVGPERRSRIISPEDRRRIAFHEAGHAVVASALPGTDPVSKLSIVARSHSMGTTWFAPEGDRVSITRSQLVDRVTAMLGGRAAELVATGEHSSGASDDLERAGSLARRMVAELGMSDRLGPFTAHAAGVMTADGLTTRASERIMAEVDEAVQEILTQAAARATAILEERRTTLDAIAESLMEVETLEGEALDRLLVPALRPSAPAGSWTPGT
ncbi:MAG: ATP-dependent zinc metalloprotease FtsH [Acidimicrobiales bacterium]